MWKKRINKQVCEEIIDLIPYVQVIIEYHFKRDVPLDMPYIKYNKRKKDVKAIVSFVEEYSTANRQLINDYEEALREGEKPAFYPSA